MKFKDIALWSAILVILGLFGYIYIKNNSKVVTPAGQVIETPVNTVETQEQLLVYASENDSLRKLIKEGDKPKVITKVVTQVKFDTLRIPFEKVVYKTKVVHDTVTKQDVVIEYAEKDFTYKDSSLAISGTVTEDNVTINTFRLDNRIDLLTIERKPKGLFKFLKKRKTTVVAVSSDPRVILTGITSVELSTPPKDNFGKGFATGAVVGAGLGIFGTLKLVK